MVHKHNIVKNSIWLTFKIATTYNYMCLGYFQGSYQPCKYYKYLGMLKTGQVQPLCVYITTYIVHVRWFSMYSLHSYIIYLGSIQTVKFAWASLRVLLWSSGKTTLPTLFSENFLSGGVHRHVYCLGTDLWTASDIRDSLHCSVLPVILNRTVPHNHLSCLIFQVSISWTMADYHIQPDFYQKIDRDKSIKY